MTDKMDQRQSSVVPHHQPKVHGRVPTESEIESIIKECVEISSWQDRRWRAHQRLDAFWVGGQIWWLADRVAKEATTRRDRMLARRRMIRRGDDALRQMREDPVTVLMRLCKQGWHPREADVRAFLGKVCQDPVLGPIYLARFNIAWEAITDDKHV